MQIINLITARSLALLKKKTVFIKYLEVTIDQRTSTSINGTQT